MRGIWINNFSPSWSFYSYVRWQLVICLRFLEKTTGVQWELNPDAQIDILYEVSDLFTNLLFLIHGTMDTFQYDVKHCHCSSEFNGRIISSDRTVTWLQEPKCIFCCHKKIILLNYMCFLIAPHIINLQLTHLQALPTPRITRNKQYVLVVPGDQRVPYPHCHAFNWPNVFCILQIDM